MSQLYAMIRKDSEYHTTQATEKPFPVVLQEPPYDGLVVAGGPGGLYALWDVVFYVQDGEELRLMPGQLAVDEWPQVWKD